MPLPRPRCRRLPLLVALALLAAPRAAAPGPPRSVPATPVLDAGGPVYGLIRGELDPAAAGEEVAFLAADGSVVLCYPGGIPWTSQVILAETDSIPGMHDRPTLSRGDVHRGWPGDEIVVLAHARLNVVHRHPSGAWSHTTLFDATGMVTSTWGARVGDYDPALPGAEIFLILEGILDFSTGTIYSEASGSWQENLVYSSEVGMDSASGEFDPFHPGPEILVTTEMGPTYEITAPALRDRGTWPIRTIWDDFENAGWVVKIGDVNPDRPGNEVVYGTRYSNRVLVSSENGAGLHDLEIAFTGSTVGGPRNMWDIALGDVLPQVAGQEIVSVDESGHVYLVWRDGGGWVGSILWTDASGPLFAVVTGDFAAGIPGEEILVAGTAGQLTLLANGGATSVPGDVVSSAAPSITVQNHPNPFRTGTAITFRQPEAGRVRLTIFDHAGRFVQELVDAHRAAGPGTAVWDGTDESGRLVGSGVYFARLETRTGSLTRKVLRVR